MSEETQIEASNQVIPVHIATQQEKLDAIFGITGGQNMDDFLDSLTLDDESTNNALSSLDVELKEKLTEYKDSTDIDLTQPSDVIASQLADIESQKAELRELVDMSKSVLSHVSNSILATPLIDSEAVQAYSKLMESIHITMAEFIQLYRDKQNFINKVKYALFDQQQKKDLLRYKHELALEMIKAKSGPNAIEADAISTNKQSWSQEEIIKQLMAQSENDQQQPNNEYS